MLCESFIIDHMPHRSHELDLALDSDSEDDDLYDYVGQDVSECEHVKGPDVLEKGAFIKEVLVIFYGKCRCTSGLLIMGVC